MPATSAPKFLLALVAKRPGNAFRLETVSARTGYVLFANVGSPLRWIDLATGRVVTVHGRAANHAYRRGLVSVPA